jgi:hypothetical protein
MSWRSAICLIWSTSFPSPHSTSKGYRWAIPNFYSSWALRFQLYSVTSTWKMIQRPWLSIHQLVSAPFEMWCTSTAKRPRPNFSPSSLLASSSSTSPRVQELRNIFWRNIIQKIINKKTRAKTVSAQWEKSNKWPSKQKPKWSRAFKQKPRIGFKPTHRFTPADLLLMRSCRGWPERSAPTFSSRC